MESFWPEDVVNSIPAAELTQLVLEKRNPEYIICFGVLKRTGRSVTVKALTVDGETARSRFIQEAALLKLLKHKSIPNLVGVSTLPPRFADVRENGTRALPVIVSEQSKGSSLSSYIQSTQLKRKSKKERTRHFDIILDVLIDVADSLLYLHHRRPAIIHRGLSMAHITVAETDSGTVMGTLNDLSSALLCAEETRRIKKLGMDSLRTEAINSEDLLSMDFFKEPLGFTASQSSSQPHTPQRPLMTSLIADRPQKLMTNSRKSLAPVPPVPKEKGSKKSVDMTGNRTTPRVRPPSANGIRGRTPSIGEDASIRDKAFVEKNKGKIQSPVSRPLEIQEESVDGDAASTPTSRISGRSHSTVGVMSQNKVEDSPIAFFSPPSITQNEKSNAVTTRTPLKKTRGYDSASSSRWGDVLINDKDGQETADLSVRTATSDAIPAGKQTEEWTPIDSGSIPLSSMSSVEKAATRADSVTHLKRAYGEAHLAPEILIEQPYGTPSDVFSFGIVIYSALAQMAPIALSQKPGHFQFTFTEGFPEEIQSLVLDCCDVKPSARPNIKVVMKRLQSMKQSGCMKSLSVRKRKKLSCFGRFG